jgi:hypothetical protein
MECSTGSGCCTHTINVSTTEDYGGLRIAVECFDSSSAVGAARQLQRLLGHSSRDECIHGWRYSAGAEGISWQI